MISCHQQLKADQTSIVGSSVTWLDDEIESLIRNEYIPDGEFRLDQACRSPDSRSYRKPSAKSMFCQHLLSQ